MCVGEGSDTRSTRRCGAFVLSASHTVFGLNTRRVSCLYRNVRDGDLDAAAPR